MKEQCGLKNYLNEEWDDNKQKCVEIGKSKENCNKKFTGMKVNRKGEEVCTMKLTTKYQSDMNENCRREDRKLIDKDGFCEKKTTENKNTIGKQTINKSTCNNNDYIKDLEQCRDHPVDLKIIV